MGYLHIDNLYKNQKIFLFKECYALEKIEGTSAHISWNLGKLGFSSGGASPEAFPKLFDHSALTAKLTELFGTETQVFIYGEAYGGKIQKMAETYGNALKFVAFDVKIKDKWLAVPQAHEFVSQLGLEFVAYEKIPATIEAVDAERDKPSRQAERNGILTKPIAEGVVLRPLIEITINNDERIISKHKRPEFSERKSKKDTNLSPDAMELELKVEELAEEWVTPGRIAHVLDKIEAELGRPAQMTETKKVIDNTIQDVYRESKGEVKEDKKFEKVAGKLAGKLFRQILEERLKTGG